MVFCYSDRKAVQPVSIRTLDRSVEQDLSFSTGFLIWCFLALVYILITDSLSSELLYSHYSVRGKLDDGAVDKLLFLGCIPPRVWAASKVIVLWTTRPEEELLYAFVDGFQSEFKAPHLYKLWAALATNL